MSPNRLNALEILRQLPRTNCRECRLPTCLAFASQVALGQRQPEDCPHLAINDVAQVRDLVEVAETDDQQAEFLDELTRRVREVDLEQAARALGARMEGDHLVARCLGREFSIDPRGRLHSACHANFWVLVPLLDAIIHAARGGEHQRRRALTGRWVKFDQLPLAMMRSAYFSKNTEAALHRLADQDLELLSDLLEMFDAREVDQDFRADLSLLIRPLPRVPLLLCYWRREGEFPSKLSLYFDSSADAHLSVESIHILATGVVSMVKRLVARHSFEPALGEEPR